MRGADVASQWSVVLVLPEKPPRPQEWRFALPCCNRERHCPIQVKQQDKVGRPDVDQFETAMRRTKRKKGFFVGFDFSQDALTEIGAFFRREHTVIVPLTVREILDEHIAQKLA